MRLILCSIRTVRVDYAVVWGASNNARSFWRDDDRARLGWQPADSADVYASQLHGKISDNPVQERFQGGAFAAQLYTRSDAEIPPTV
jgi:uronate dehydrogenase